VKSLDKKLKIIAAGKYKPRDFILADAKDPDYAFGVKGTGAHDHLDQSGKHRSIPEFRQTIRDMVKQKQMDVMLGAVSNMELLIEDGLFEKSAVTPAIRANDTTDIWHPRSGNYAKEPSRPWRTATRGTWSCATSSGSTSCWCRIASPAAPIPICMPAR
jgi:hypothetical protein